MAIALSCSCGKSLQVKDEFVGQRVRCPACSDVLTVPSVAPPRSRSSRTKNRHPVGRKSSRLRENETTTRMTARVSVTAKMMTTTIARAASAMARRRKRRGGTVAEKAEEETQATERAASGTLALQTREEHRERRCRRRVAGEDCRHRLVRRRVDERPDLLRPANSPGRRVIAFFKGLMGGGDDE